MANASSSTTSTPTSRRFRMSAPVLAVLPAILLGAVVGAGVGLNSGWGGGVAAPVIQAAGFAALCWIIAAGLGLFVLLAVSQGECERLGFAVLGSSAVRMMGALAIGLGVFFISGTEGKTFWVAFLISGVFALGAETVWAMRALTTHPTRAAGAATGAGVS